MFSLSGKRSLNVNFSSADGFVLKRQAKKTATTLLESLHACVIRGTLIFKRTTEIKKKGQLESCHSFGLKEKKSYISTNDPSRMSDKLLQEDGQLDTHCISIQFNPFSDVIHCTLQTFKGQVVQ